MNQRKRDQKKKARKIEVRKKVLARREEIRKQRKEEVRLEEEFEAKELKNLSKDEINERIEQNYKILQGIYEEMQKKAEELEKAKLIKGNIPEIPQEKLHGDLT
jgi:hypothetical protein